MVDNIELNQIAIVLSQLVHNYNVLAQNWFKVFYDSTPDGAINLSYFDDEGNLKYYTICNRAYDRMFLLHGEGSPENVVSAATGSLYQDTLNGAVYFKATTGGTDIVSTTGWLQLQPLSQFHSYGTGKPIDTDVEIGHLYTDTETGQLYTLTPSGWEQVGATGFATEEWVTEQLNELRGWVTEELEEIKTEIEGGVVHLSGDENITGSKTFSGTTNFSGNVNVTSASTFTETATFQKVIMGTAYRALSADIAEYYNADEQLEPGTLVQFGGEKEITKAQEMVNGVVSTNPAYILNAEKDMENPTLLALSGRIPVKVKGSVHKFDLITLSDEKGVAKVDNSCYNCIGRALETNLDEGIKLVECVVKLHI